MGVAELGAHDQHLKVGGRFFGGGWKLRKIVKRRHNKRFGGARGPLGEDPENR